MDRPPALLATLRDVARALEALDATYMLVGGVALAAWARPRATTDVDFVLSVAEGDLPAVGALLARRVGGLSSMRPFRFRDGTTFQRVVVQRPEGEVLVDLIPATSPFLKAALGRRSRRQLGDTETYVASAEDLVLMKLQANRPRDRVDVSDLVGAQKLDVAYVRRWAKRLGLTRRLARALPAVPARKRRRPKPGISLAAGRRLPPVGAGR